MQCGRGVVGAMIEAPKGAECGEGNWSGEGAMLGIFLLLALKMMSFCAFRVVIFYT